MEREANYTAVGAFVILVTVMAGLFVYWYSEGRDQRNYVPYEIYFQGSVTGLSEGGSVRYLGVDVGKVRRIRLDPRSAERVQVIVEIDSAAPISKATTAELSLLGITGLLYIDLRQYVKGREVLPPVPSERYPVIVALRSKIDTFLDSLPEIAAGAAELIQRAQEIFSEENTKALAGMVENLHAASANLPATMQKLDALLVEMNATSREVRRLTVSVQGTTEELTPQIREFTTRLVTTSANLEKASADINSFVAENRGSLTGFARDGLPQLQRTLEEARSAAEAVRELSRSLKENPSQLLYQTPPRGVKVER